MYTSPNMTLTVWDLNLDDFEHQQLAQNFLQLDSHDHSATKGVQISTGGLRDLSVTQAKLGLGVVGNTNMQNNAVSTPVLQDASVTAAKLAPGSVGPGAIAAGSITAALLDPTLIPVGQVMPWWRPPGSTATPGGYWEVCDGRPWSTITNFWGLTTGTIPDLRGRFVQGADGLTNFGPTVGGTGGTSSVSLGHTHGVLAHSHTSATHSHPIASDGDHGHTWVGGLQTSMRPNCFAQGVVVNDWRGFQHPNTFYSLHVKEPNIFQTTTFNYNTTTDDAAHMDNAGTHNHFGSTGRNLAFSTDPATAVTDAGSGATGASVVPPYVGLMYIMRCR